MVKVIATNYIKAEHIEAAKPLFREILEATNKEDGCLEYKLYENKDEPGLYVFVEEWESMAHLEAHFQTDHFKRIVPLLGGFAAKQGGVQVLSEFK
ncbi:MAG: antibiotic biosynthesis monooxygenase [Treponema sp.]|nr:antibiotic biosynthesis monooxygenase [Treponema sp.]